MNDLFDIFHEFKGKIDDFVDGVRQFSYKQGYRSGIVALYKELYEVTKDEEERRIITQAAQSLMEDVDKWNL